jgi:hypothetical protein
VLGQFKTVDVIVAGRDVGVGDRAGPQAVATMAMMQSNWVKVVQIQFAQKFCVNSVTALNVLSRPRTPRSAAR